ncbi:MAG: hypothetical protein K6C40_00265 [Thermoguttaceae bacterium]|nr:hypothetical protein [Thermoguttaceae bacterium]
MKKSLLAAVVLCGFLAVFCRADGASDWLIDPKPYTANIQIADDSDAVILENGLIRREIVTKPGAATVSLKNLVSSEEFIRAAAPEGKLTINGKAYSVGGLAGPPVQNYLKPEWIASAAPSDSSWTFGSARIEPVAKPFDWKKHPEWMGQDYDWPPKGKHVVLTFQPTLPELPKVEVHYEIYDGIPALCKWIVVTNTTDKAMTVDRFTVEILKLVEQKSSVDGRISSAPQNILVISDYAFGDMLPILENCRAGRFTPDPEYTTQVSYLKQEFCLLDCSPELGPAQRLQPGETFETYRIYELLFDSTERQRRSLSLARLYRTLAPWTNENPLMFHKTTAKPEHIREGIEQCKATGFEVIIMSFGSGFNLESKDPNYRAVYKQLADEARNAGLGLGGYSLTASRNAGTLADNVQNPSPRYGRCPCLGSAWGKDYHETLKSFMAEAGFQIFENDGPYPGDFCEATDHPGHHDKSDSVWVQWKAQADLYKFCCANGIYVNQPDGYFFSGGNKTGMGYRERNWSLPRAEQLIIERQNIYDGTWDKTCSMGWMFVPLTQYHGGGAAATIEPLCEHLPHYDGRFANLIGAGVQACYRGPRLYDTPETLAVVKKWVDFYKAHRQVLDADFVHLRRADGRDWDGWLKVNPQAREKGLAFFYNPLTEPIERTISVPLYYTGLTGKATVAVNGLDPQTVPLDAQSNAKITIKIPAEGYVWVLFTE